MGQLNYCMYSEAQVPYLLQRAYTHYTICLAWNQSWVRDNCLTLRKATIRKSIKAFLHDINGIGVADNFVIIKQCQIVATVVACAQLFLEHICSTPYLNS